MPDTGDARKVVVLGSNAPYLVNFRGSLVSELVDHGYEVIGIAPDFVGPPADVLRDLGAWPLTVPLAGSNLSPLDDLAYLRRLEALFQELKPHVVIAYTIKPVVWGALAASRAGVPAFISMITGLGYAFVPGNELKRRIVHVVAKRLYRLALGRCKAVIFQNPDDRRDFIELGLVDAGKTHIVDGSGIDIERFPLTPVPSQPTFLMLCRLLRDKGVGEYAEAAKLLKARHPDVSVRLLGPSDPSPNAISPEEVMRLSEGALEYGGAVGDVRPAIAAASVYVLPSYREGTPRSTLEAMAMGRAIVTTDVPGCRETVIQDENGFLVPARDASALASAMSRFVERSDLATVMGRRSRRIAEERYDVRRVNRQIMTIAGLVRENGSPAVAQQKGPSV